MKSTQHRAALLGSLAGILVVLIVAAIIVSTVQGSESSKAAGPGPPDEYWR